MKYPALKLHDTDFMTLFHFSFSRDLIPTQAGMTEKVIFSKVSTAIH